MPRHLYIVFCVRLCVYGPREDDRQVRGNPPFLFNLRTVYSVHRKPKWHLLNDRPVRDGGLQPVHVHEELPENVWNASHAHLRGSRGRVPHVVFYWSRHPILVLRLPFRDMLV